MVLAAGVGHVYVHGDRQSGVAHTQVSLWGFFAGVLMAAGIAYFVGGVYVRTRAAVPERRVAKMADAVCRRGTNCAYQLPDAIGDLHSVFLPLHNGSLLPRWASLGLAADSCAFRRTGGHQQSLAEALSIRPHGMIVARHDLRRVSLYEEGRELATSGSLTG